MLTSNEISPTKINWPGFLTLVAALLGLLASFGLGYGLSLAGTSVAEQSVIWRDLLVYSIPALILIAGILTGSIWAASSSDFGTVLKVCRNRKMPKAEVR